MVYTNVTNVLNSTLISKSENIFDSLLTSWSYNIFYSKFIYDSNNVWFSTNLIWCSECIFCDWLDNQKYYINNKGLEKEEYFKEKLKILKNKKLYFKYKSEISHKWENKLSENSKWNAILSCENIENWYMISKINNWKNIMFS